MRTNQDEGARERGAVRYGKAPGLGSAGTARHERQPGAHLGQRAQRTGLPGLSKLEANPRLLAPIGLGVAATIALAAIAIGSCSPADTTQDGVSSGTVVGDLFEDSSLFTAQSSSFAAELVRPSSLAPITSGTPSVDGGQASDETLAKLASAVQAIESSGYEVGYAFLDLSSGASVSYNADALFYSASSIKGPYVASLARYELGSDVTSEASRISAILEDSDNASYTRLRAVYGDSCFAQLIEESGAQQMQTEAANDGVARAASSLSASSISDNYYEFYSPNQLLALWQQVYDYLTSGEDGAEWLASEFELPADSSIRYTAGGYGTTWSKAGWYPEEAVGYGTTVDAGVVRTSSGDVLLAVMTTKPEDLDALDSIVAPLMELHEELAS